MLSLRSFARTTLGELKDALIDDADDDDEEDEDANSNVANTSKLQPPTAVAAAETVAARTVAGSAATAAAVPVALKAPTGFPRAPSLPPQPPPLPQAPTQQLRQPIVPEPTIPANVLQVGFNRQLDDAVIFNRQLDAAMALEEAVMASRAASMATAPDGAAASAALGTPPTVGTTAVPFAENKDELLAALRGKQPDSVQQLCADAANARRRFAALLAMPCLDELLANCGDGSWTSAEVPSVPRIGAQCAEALWLLAPRVLASERGSDQQQLLESFSERYDTLLNQYEAMQQRCRKMSEVEDCSERLTQQLEVWQAAYATATARIEELASENAELKERLAVLDQRRSEPDDRPTLLRRLSQREAEVRAANDALQRLQDVLEDGDNTTTARLADLECQLQAARRAIHEAELAKQNDAAALREAQEAAAHAARREAALVERCAGVERDTQEIGAALEVLLQEKEQHLEQRDNQIDRKLVASMLALYLEHSNSGHHALASQALQQTLQVLGGEPAIAERQRWREEATPKPGPLGDAFIDFLSREVNENKPPVSEG